MALSVSIHEDVFCFIRDEQEGRFIGSGFVFLKPNWVVTAKHVVIDEGRLRPSISFETKRKSGQLTAAVVDPHHDLAILRSTVDISPRPLFPTYAEFSSVKELISIGYKPSLSSPTGVIAECNHIPQFQIEKRERISGVEEIIQFKDPGMEGGHSGGPVLGEGGNVAAVVIDRFQQGAVNWARATSILHLMKYVSIVDEQNA